MVGYGRLCARAQPRGGARLAACGAAPARPAGWPVQARRGQAGSTRPRKVAKNANVGVAGVASTSTTVQLRQRQHRLSCLRFHTPTGTHACSGRNRALQREGASLPGPPRETAGGGGPSRCAVAPLCDRYDKTFRQPLSAVLSSPATRRGQGLRGARRSRSGRTAQYYLSTPRHSAQQGFIAVGPLLLLESCVQVQCVSSVSVCDQ